MGNEKNDLECSQKECTISRGKAIWDSETVNLFCDFCIKEVEDGHRPGTHFDKVGWSNLVRKFSEATRRTYAKLQLKNKWDSLKNDWKLWKQLIGKETGLGWNVRKKTIDASKEWWQNKLQLNPNFSKFRIRGIEPDLEEKLDRMFMNTVATRKDAWTLSFGIVPSENVISNDNDTPLEEVESSNSNETTQNEVAKNHRKRPSEQHEKRNKKARKGNGKSKVGGAIKLSEQIDHLIDVVASRSSSGTSNARNQLRHFSITKVMEELESLPGLEIGSTLHFFAAHLFMKEEMRETFMAFKQPHLKRNRLKYVQSLGPSS